MRRVPASGTHLAVALTGLFQLQTTPLGEGAAQRERLVDSHRQGRVRVVAVSVCAEGGWSSHRPLSRQTSQSHSHLYLLSARPTTPTKPFICPCTCVTSFFQIWEVHRDSAVPHPSLSALQRISSTGGTLAISAATGPTELC